MVAGGISEHHDNLVDHHSHANLKITTLDNSCTEESDGKAGEAAHSLAADNSKVYPITRHPGIYPRHNHRKNQDQVLLMSTTKLIKPANENNSVLMKPVHERIAANCNGVETRL